jgi:hypothetical protein
MSCPRCDTLLQLLALDVPAPEILLEEDGDICVDYGYHGPSPIVSISINPKGGVAWAVVSPTPRHGTDLDEVIGILRKKAER